jgi:RNase P/RNase MRP subunit p29
MAYQSMREERIGKTLTVLEAKNTSLKGQCGIIRQETKNTFRLESQTKNGEITKTILKKDAVFMIDGKKVDGNTLIKRPQDL